jgi:hypothetical protein
LDFFSFFEGQDQGIIVFGHGFFLQIKTFYCLLSFDILFEIPAL